MEHTKLFALVDMLPSLDGDITRADLDHADGHEGHKPDGRVIRLDEDDRAGGDGGDVSLGPNGAPDVDLTAARRIGIGIGIGEALEERLGIVCAVLDKGLADRPRDGGVPAVVGEGGEECLVDGGAFETVCEVVKGEHVED